MPITQLLPQIKVSKDLVIKVIEKSESPLISFNNSQMVGRKRVLKFEKQLELQIDKASNGLEAFSMFKEYLLSSQCQFLCPLSSYKLIIMDLNMPVMDGFEASEKILRCF